MAMTSLFSAGDWMKKISLQFISEREFEKIERSCVRLKFKKGETILKQDAKPTHVVYLESGIVKFNYDTDAGKNIILTIVSAPKILGGANLYYKDNNMFSFVAVEECEAVMIDSDVLLNVLSTNAKFAIALYQVAADMFKKSIMNFISLASKQKEGRIADIILYLADEVYHSNAFQLKLTRRELSEFAGCSAENVIMTLSKWQSEKIIHTEGKKFEIINAEKLKHISKIG